MLSACASDLGSRLSQTRRAPQPVRHRQRSFGAKRRLNSAQTSARDCSSKLPAPINETGEFSSNVVLRKIRSAGIRLRAFVISQQYGFTPDNLYDDAFYDGSGFAKTENAAEKIGNFLVEKYKPKSVLDIGCGQGNYLKYFAQSGCLAIGCDGSSRASQEFRVKPSASSSTSANPCS